MNDQRTFDGSSAGGDGDRDDDVDDFDNDAMSTKSTGEYSQSSGGTRSSSGSSGGFSTGNRSDRRSYDSHSSAGSYAETSSEHSKTSGDDRVDEQDGAPLLSQEESFIGMLRECMEESMQRQQAEVLLLKSTLEAAGKVLHQDRCSDAGQPRSPGEAAAISPSSSSLSSASHAASNHADGSAESSSDGTNYDHQRDAIYKLEIELLENGVSTYKLQKYRDMFRLKDAQLAPLEDLLSLDFDDGNESDEL